MIKLIKAVILLTLIGLALNGCSGSDGRNGDSASKVKTDLEEIQERGVLRAITSYSPISYFIYRGQPLGYEYEMLKRLTDYLGVELQLVVASDFTEMIRMLNSGEGDMIAYNLTLTSDRQERVAFTVPMNTTHQVLVQRKPSNWRQMRLHEIERTLIRSPFELNGETIHVRRASSYLDRLINLSAEIGGDIDIVEADGSLTTEELIRMVAEREIEYTVSDENIARLNAMTFPILDIETPISLPQQTAWAVRHNSPVFLETLNNWLTDFQREADYYVIYRKYFENTRAYRARVRSDFLFSASGRISAYDDIIKRYADELGWDWKLIASLIFQESQFNPNARSWAGAVGLMQLMPRTAEAYGAADPTDPVQSVRAGVRFLQWLEDYWEDHIEDDQERKHFVLASYNVGQGHVQDARRLAEKYDADPNVWHDNVARFMLKKSNADYYNDEVVRFGYARGIEPVQYVDHILYIYNHYLASEQLRTSDGLAGADN